MAHRRISVYQTVYQTVYRYMWAYYMCLWYIVLVTCVPDRQASGYVFFLAVCAANRYLCVCVYLCRVEVTCAKQQGMLSVWLLHNDVLYLDIYLLFFRLGIYLYNCVVVCEYILCRGESRVCVFFFVSGFIDEQDAALSMASCVFTHISGGHTSAWLKPCIDIAERLHKYFHSGIRQQVLSLLQAMLVSVHHSRLPDWAPKTTTAAAHSSSSVKEETSSSTPGVCFVVSAAENRGWKPGTNPCRSPLHEHTMQLWTEKLWPLLKAMLQEVKAQTGNVLPQSRKGRRERDKATDAAGKDQPLLDWLPTAMPSRTTFGVQIAGGGSGADNGGGDRLIVRVGYGCRSGMVLRVFW